MKVLFDTNVVLDLLLNRIPHNQSALTLFKSVETGKVEGVLCATTLTTISYLVAKSQNRQTAHQAILGLMRLFQIAPVNEHTLTRALNANYTDFEDAVLYSSGVIFGVDALVTRNTKDFMEMIYPVYFPTSLVDVLNSSKW